MRLKLNNNVFLVSGAVYDCIYDLNTGQLYHLSKNVSAFLADICRGDIHPDTVTDPRQKQLLQYLTEEGILCGDNGQTAAPVAVPEKESIQTAWLEITQCCNFRCVHCYEGHKARVSLSYGDIVSIIDLLRENKVAHLHIIGGEPMLHGDIEAILDYCTGKFETFSIYTNASVISAGICARLKKLNATVYVSLNSDIEEDFNRITGTRNLFHKVLKGIEMLRQSGLAVVVKKVTMTGISVSPQYEAFYGSFGGFPILVGNASLAQYSDDMLKKKIITEESFGGKLDAKSVLINMRENYCFRDRIYIDVYGDVYPCAMERRVKYGNIFRMAFQEVISSPIVKTTKDAIHECRECEYRYACNTCHVDTLSDDFYAKPWFCSYRPKEGIWTPYEEFVQELNRRYL